MNGTVGDGSSANSAAREGSASASKPWEHVWSVEEMRSTAPDWHLANDVGVSYSLLVWNCWEDYHVLILLLFTSIVQNLVLALLMVVIW